jgi:Domain of unknown function (DUF1707)
MSTSPVQRAGTYRVGDAERTRTIELLKEAHADGYLGLDEVDERLSGALAARTRDELDRLVADLPPEWLARQAPRPPAPPRRRLPPADSLVAVMLLLVVVAIVVGAVTRGFFFFPWPLLWLWFVFGHRRSRAGWHTHRF